MVPLGRAAVVVQLAELLQSITRGHGFESNHWQFSSEHFLLQCNREKEARNGYF